MYLIESIIYLQLCSINIFVKDYVGYLCKDDVISSEHTNLDVLSDSNYHVKIWHATKS